MDEEEFSAFFRSMRPRLVKYAARTLDTDSANQVATDALATIWRKGVSRPDGESGHEVRLASLTFRIADGLIRNQLRALGRRRRLHDVLVGQARVGYRSVLDVADQFTGANNEVREAFSRLSKADRHALSLLIDGYQVQEIADILGCSAKAASMRIARARERLRDAIGKAKGES